MNNLTDIIAKTDLVHLVEHAGAELKRESAGELRGTCPIHRGENKTGFAVYLDGDKQRWRCWSGDCGGGDVVDFIMALNRCDFNTAYHSLGGEMISMTDEQRTQLAAERVKRAEERERQKWTEYQNALAELRAARAWETYTSNLLKYPEARDIWRLRGIPDVHQELWQLGYCASFPVSTSMGTWRTATLTIPIFDKDEEPINIRHRLLNPPTPTDKYRPDRPGLHAAPFIADPERDDKLERVLVVEGEIKAMVAYITADDPAMQVYGIPGKTNFKAIQKRLAGRAVYVCLDPDAKGQALDAARAVGGWVIELPVKIDDAILAGSLDKYGLRRLLKYARKA